MTDDTAMGDNMAIGEDMDTLDTHAPEDVAGSLTLFGAVSLGTGVMIGAGIFAITGQAAGLAGDLFPVAFLVAAIVVGVSAYSYVKLSNAFPSSGGIAMFLQAEYGPGTTTGVFAIFMYVSMIINESLVARTFSAYSLQILHLEPASFWIPALGVALLIVAFAVNLAGNRIIQTAEGAMAAIKIVGLTVFAMVGLWLADIANFTNGSDQGGFSRTADGFLAAVALSILAYKGFTTITNSGGEIVDPHRNVGRAIIISIAICTAMYLALSIAVAGNLTLPEIISAQDFALAEAARPAFGDAGVWFTVALAVIATASGVIASVFAASRMLAMLTRMKQVPHSHFGLPGTVRTHTMIYTVTFAIGLTIAFDLRRIAALGAVFYLLMDIAIHWGILRHLRDKIDFKPAIVVAAIVLDVLVLGAFLWVKASADPLILYASATGIIAILVGERLFMRSHTHPDGTMEM
ncbi:MAG: APC family permease [Acidimicrobiales bacterium]